MSSGLTVKKDFVTQEGYIGLIMLITFESLPDHSHLNGYVGVDEKSPLFEMSYLDIEKAYDISVHGGLTFSGYRNFEDVSNNQLWYFGYDCGHCNDDMKKCNLDYNTNQVKLLSKQIKEIERSINERK